MISFYTSTDNQKFQFSIEFLQSSCHNKMTLQVCSKHLVNTLRESLILKTTVDLANCQRHVDQTIDSFHKLHFPLNLLQNERATLSLKQLYCVVCRTPHPVVTRVP